MFAHHFGRIAYYVGWFEGVTDLRLRSLFLNSMRKPPLDQFRQCGHEHRNLKSADACLNKTTNSLQMMAGTLTTTPRIRKINVEYHMFDLDGELR